MANGSFLDTVSSTNGAQSAPWKFATKAYGSSTWLIIAPPAVDVVAARRISAAGCVANGYFTPEPQIYSMSFIAAHAHPIVATVPNGLSREAAAILVPAGV